MVKTQAPPARSSPTCWDAKMANATPDVFILYQGTWVPFDPLQSGRFQEQGPLSWVLEDEEDFC